MSFQSTIVAIMIVYITGMLAIGYYFYQKGIVDLEDYFLAGKGAGWYLVALSFFATAIGAGGTIGLTGDTYAEESITVFWTYGITIGGFFIVAFVLGHKLPRTKGITVPELLEDRYDGRARIVAIPFYLLRFISTLGAQWLAAGAIISFAFGDLITVDQAVIAGAVIITVYTLMGGMSAVMWTDFIQGLILFVGLWILAIVGIQNLGGWSDMTNEVTDTAPQAFDLFAMEWTLIAGLAVTLLPQMLVRQGYLQRIMSARSSRDGFVGVLLNGIIGSVYIVVPLLLGTMGLVYYGDGIGDSDLLLPTMVVDLLPVWFAGIILAALAASIMSSGDSFLLSGASNITEDIYLRYIEPDADLERQRLVSRLSVIALMILSVYLSTLIPGIIDLIVFGSIALTAGVVVPFLGVFYWPRATSDAAFWSLVIGAGSAVTWWWAGWFAGTEEFLGFHPVFIGLPLSILLFIGISYAQEPEYDKVIQSAQRQNLDSLEEKARQAKQEYEQ